MDYLSLPLALKKGYLNKTDLYESISHHIGLILSAREGILPFEPEFGCNIWEKEFSDIYTMSRADIRASIRNAIDKFEKRLYNVSVSISEVSTEHSHALGLVIKVSGHYRDEDKEQKFEETFNIG
jgi:phage baseplate assembly protein W